MNLAAAIIEQRSLKLDELTASGSLFDLAQQHDIFLPSNIRNASPKRAYEYLGGRICASEALKALGCSNVGELLSSDLRLIEWPKGFIASISHSEGRITAVATTQGELLGIGVDIEKYMSDEKAARLASRLLTSEEQTNLILPGDFAGLKTTLIFSAKESIFKSIYPLTKVYFGFKDASCLEINDSKTNMLFKLNRRLSQKFNEQTVVSVAYKLQDGFVETLCKV